MILALKKPKITQFFSDISTLTFDISALPSVFKMGNKFVSKFIERDATNVRHFLRNHCGLIVSTDEIIVNILVWQLSLDIIVTNTKSRCVTISIMVC